MGTIARDAFSGNIYDDRCSDLSNGHPTNPTTSYNPTYRTNSVVEEPAFGIFDDLERQRPIGRRSLPHAQMAGMAGTFNSFPYRPPDEPSRIATSFTNSNGIAEIQVVTDMLDDMTKDDNMPDEFIEALNPNLIPSRTSTQPEYRSPGWFSVC